MNERLAKAEALFHDALELPPEQRETFLRQACGDDADLRHEVAALLRAAGVADHWLSEPSASTRHGGISEGPGTVIGRYKLLQQIGEGGCGIVYMAEQQQPVRRRVALKVIKLGMDTKQVVARFEAERQALAMMDHPNIAKALDAGATDTGRPYFVMELVRGIKITDYCDQNNLTTAQRLDLFIQICQAIQHAHQKGIIHRDLKPSNILVTLHDGVPVPKVIDFGIAKATGEQRLTDKTLFTAFQQFIGTPAYMSPEQAEMSGLDIDARTDIYALGVLLYELLTGKTPFDAKELMAAGLDEIRRTIREQEPVRPSTRLSTMLAGELTTTAHHRRTDAPRLLHLVRGDLDWIVMKCLEKDRIRRYGTTGALTADLNRFLNNEPIVAKPAGRIYRVQKLIRRRRGRIVAAGLMLGALLVGIVATPLFRSPAPAAKAFDAAVARLPKRNPATPPNLIDLSKFYNVSLEGSGGWQIAPSSEHAIQKGVQRLGDILFDIRGGVRLFSPYPQYVSLPFPQRVDGIKLSQHCRRLHFLHFVFNSEQTNRTVATYSVRYSNGKASDIPVRYGDDVRTWAANTWGSADPRYSLGNTNSTVAWIGTNVAMSPTRLFRTTWDNPQPELAIKTIDFISNLTDCAPVLVAITVEP